MAKTFILQIKSILWIRLKSIKEYDILIKGMILSLKERINSNASQYLR